MKCLSVSRANVIKFVNNVRRSLWSVRRPSPNRAGSQRSIGLYEWPYWDCGRREGDGARLPVGGLRGPLPWDRLPGGTDEERGCS